jgi:hypothetical protein
VLLKRLSLLPASLVLLLSSCSDVGQVCTLIGCYDGLSVTLASPPATPFRVEAYVQVGLGSRYTQTCNATPCYVFFPGFTPPAVRIDVIAGVDTVTREFTPAYVLSRPNGPQCDPECRNATVTFVP